MLLLDLSGRVEKDGFSFWWLYSWFSTTQHHQGLNVDEQSCLHKAEGKSKVTFEQKGLIPAYKLQMPAGKIHKGLQFLSYIIPSVTP